MEQRLTHTQQLALEKLVAIIDEMKEVGLELYQEYAPTLLEAGLKEQDLQNIRKDITRIGTYMAGFDAAHKQLRQSAVTITHLDVREIFYKPEQAHIAQAEEQQLRDQGFEAHPSVADQQPLYKDILIARLRKIVESHVA